MTPRLAAKIRDLVEQGVVVVGPKPVQSPSLSDQGGGDATVKRLADEVWDGCDGKTVKEHAFGKAVCSGHAGRRGTVPPEPEAGLRVQRRRCGTRWRGSTVPSRTWTSTSSPIKGLPLWRSVHLPCERARPGVVAPGHRLVETAPVWSETDGRVTVPIRFDPAGSVFVVFRRPSLDRDHLVAATWPGADAARP